MVGVGFDYVNTRRINEAFCTTRNANIINNRPLHTLSTLGCSHSLHDRKIKPNCKHPDPRIRPIGPPSRVHPYCMSAFQTCSRRYPAHAITSTPTPDAHIQITTMRSVHLARPTMQRTPGVRRSGRPPLHLSTHANVSLSGFAIACTPPTTPAPTQPPPTHRPARHLDRH